jgi:CBS domain-containing protein
MKHACTSAVVVAGKDCGVAGIFTERDVVKAIRAGMDVSRTPISAVMTRDPICVTGDTEDLAAMRIMAQRRFRHLPVVESEDRPVLIGLHDSLQLGKSLLQSGSRSIMSRAKTFLKTLFATRESHGLLSEELSASLHTVVKEKASSLAVSSNATVAKALEIMTDMQSSALLVKTPRRPAEIEGIFTERDLCVPHRGSFYRRKMQSLRVFWDACRVSRVVALHKDPQVTTLADVMTKEPECIDAGASVEVGRMLASS